jgi:predicted RNA-binding protein associated with RNAse of E/G family
MNENVKITEDRMKRLMEETRGLVAKWDKKGLLNGLTNEDTSSMDILTESHSSLLFDDGTQIDYFTEEEKQQKLKKYYDKKDNT